MIYFIHNFHGQKCKSISITVLSKILAFHMKMYIYSAVMWLRKDFHPFIVSYPYIGKKNFQKYIFHYNKVRSHFIVIFQGAHLNEVFKTIQGVYSLKTALVKNLVLYLWRQVMRPLKANNLRKPSIKLNPFTFRLSIT